MAEDADPATVRTAYRRLLFRHHPDVSDAADAELRTRELLAALRAILGAAPPAEEAPGVAGGSTRPPARATAGSAPRSTPDVESVDEDTLAVALPPDETLQVLVEVAHRLGDIAYLDVEAGLLEVVVEFIDAPTSSLLVHLQGRATGWTEVVCTVEPLSGGLVPPTAAVTELVRRTILQEFRRPAS